MRRTGWRRSRALASCVTLAALLVSGCTSVTAGTATPTTVVPATWVEQAVRAWPESPGRAARIMYFSRDTECVLDGEQVRVLDTTPEWRDTGYGPVEGSKDPAAFVHECRILSDAEEHRFAGSVQLRHFGDPAGLSGFVADFVDEPDTAVQDNEVGSVTSGRYTVHTLKRWYPTNPQGLYQAMVEDEPQRVAVLLEVNSLTAQDFAQTSPQLVADALTALLDRGHGSG